MMPALHQEQKSFIPGLTRFQTNLVSQIRTRCHKQRQLGFSIGLVIFCLLVLMNWVFVYKHKTNLRTRMVEKRLAKLRKRAAERADRSPAEVNPMKRNLVMYTYEL